MRRLAARCGILGAVAAFALGPAAATAPADLTSLKASCSERDAADGDTGNGVELPYVFCDDGVPPTGGRQPNVGAVRAVAVPQRYDGFAGLPPKAAPDPNAGADPDGNIALDVDVSLPAGSPPAGGWPLVVMMHGCCGGDKTGWEAATVDASGEKWHYSNAWFASRGYVVLTYTARGFVNGQGQGSTGETQLDSRLYEMNDYQHLAGQLADDPFFGIDPARVVTTGGSYGGGFSWMALTDPTWTSPGGTPMRLAATAPKYGWTDIVYSLIPNGLHRRDSLPATDGSDTTTPFGFPKRSILAGLFASGRVGVPPVVGPHATFSSEVDDAFVCLESTDPYESNPLCARPFAVTLPSFINDRSAYYQNHFFERIAGDPAARVPVFSAGPFTDPLFTSIEHRRMVERLKSVVPDYPVQEHYGDVQHFVQNKPKEWNDVCGADRHVCERSDYPGGDLDAAPATRVLTGTTTWLNRFLDHYARPEANPSQPEPERTVTAALQICPQNASAAFPADEPGERFTAPSFGALAPNTLRVEARGQQVTTSDAEPNPHARRADPVVNEVTNGRRCPVEQAPGGTSTAGPGVATYDSAPLERDYTMIGQTRVTVPHTGSGSGIQLNARLYDLFPDGTQVMVDRGVRRVPGPNGTTVFDLHGNGWRFPAGHRVRIELAQDDDPYIKQSTQPSALTLAGATLEIPVREGGESLAGTVPAQRGARIRLRVTPRRAAAGRRTRFSFRARASGVPVRRARIRFAGRRARTNARGRATIRVRLRRPGRYRARATRRGLRPGRATVRAVRAAAPRFTG